MSKMGSDLMISQSTVHPKRLLFITLEYKAGTFSGNGIYSQSMVRSLARLGHSVLVVSAAPAPGGQFPNSKPKEMETDVIQVAVPGALWGRLDWKCAWKEFAEGISDEIAEKVASYRPEWSLIVDWSALDAFKAIMGKKTAWAKQAWPCPPMAYLNYRVYTLSEYKGEQAEQEKAFYKDRESACVALAATTAALSQRDAAFARGFLAAPKDGSIPDPLQFRALLPPLREDIRIMALTSTAQPKQDASGKQPNGVLSSGPMTHAGEDRAELWQRGRKYVSCCVRLSPEKNAELFASIIEHLAPLLKEQGLLPLLCAGANSGSEYASSIKSRILTAFPTALIVEGFMGPDRLSDIYAQTLLNIHPCLYDAYGMTIVEAGAFGAPSVVNVGSSGAVGAAELVLPSEDQCFPLDLSQQPKALADSIQTLIADRTRLAMVGLRAQAKCVSWSEEANARQLTCILEDATKSRTGD